MPSSKAKLTAATLEAEVLGRHLDGSTTLRQALGNDPTIIGFLRHFG